ncbi:MAG TPA: hypothetical protein VL172_17950, partial [Kofleriaceae bacterium]|nr:hypothetical protein [Kofleriaceae bacterium]
TRHRDSCHTIHALYDHFYDIDGRWIMDPSLGSSSGIYDPDGYDVWCSLQHAEGELTEEDGGVHIEIFYWVVIKQVDSTQCDLAYVQGLPEELADKHVVITATHL